MFEVHRTHWCFVALLVSAAYILYYFDKKKSDLYYRRVINQRRDEIKLNGTSKLKYRLMAFPISNNVKYIEKFVNREVTGS